jgi:hypothetical protein
MNGYIFTTLAGAQAVGAVVDPALGYPKAGVNVGGGVHVTPLFVTQTYWIPIKHPTLTQWAYISDGNVDPIVAANLVALGSPVSVVLPATWFPVAVTV